MDADAGAAPGGEAGQEGHAMEAAPLADPLCTVGAPEAQDAGEAEGPELDGAPGREGGQDAKEDGALQIVELAVAPRKTPGIAR